MAALYAWLNGMPPEQMTQTIGLLGSGLIMAIIAVFIAVAAGRRINAYEAFVEGRQGRLRRRRADHSHLIAMLIAISVFRHHAAA